jgi:hypothetical protein
MSAAMPPRPHTPSRDMLQAIEMGNTIHYIAGCNVTAQTRQTVWNTNCYSVNVASHLCSACVPEPFVVIFGLKCLCFPCPPPSVTENFNAPET